MASVDVLVERKDEESLREAVAGEHREWMARRQVLERRKENVDRQLAVAVEKTDAMAVLDGDEYSEKKAQRRVAALRNALEAQLGMWEYTDEMKVALGPVPGSWGASGDREPRPYVGLVSRMMVERFGEVSVVSLEREAVKLVDLVAARVFVTPMWFRLVVDHGSDVREFVEEYAAELGLERRV